VSVLNRTVRRVHPPPPGWPGETRP
jgi:hypothetical protein